MPDYELVPAPLDKSTKLYSYDLVPYESHPFAQSDPNALASMAVLFGLTPVPPPGSRVLELGCSAGGNILPLAARYPDMQVTGVELSHVQADRARQAAESLGLTNVRIRQADILEIAAEEGEYDYIIAHGVYSWVPEQVQDAILRICGRQLSRNGVAYISYNVYPGWKTREVIREMMLYHAGGLNDPVAKLQQGRAILDFVRRVQADDSAFGKLLAQEAEIVMKANDYYLYHDHMEENNRPCYFKDFVQHSAKHGLVYLGESRLADMSPQRLGTDVSEMLSKLTEGNILATEQYMDFVANRMFRQTLLVRALHLRNINRSVSPDRVGKLHFSAKLSPSEEKPDDALAAYQHASGRIVARDPDTMTVLEALSSAQPFTLGVSDIVQRMRELQLHAELSDAVLEEIVASHLLVLLLNGIVRLHFTSVPRVDVGDRPTAFGPARLSAAEGESLAPNRLHETVGLTEVQAAVLSELDGTVDRTRLKQNLLKRVERGDFVVTRGEVPVSDETELSEIVGGFVDECVAAFGDRALLVG